MGAFFTVFVVENTDTGQTMGTFITSFGTSLGARIPTNKKVTG